MNSSAQMPEALREEVIEILASALVADVEKHPELYGLEGAADQAVAASTGDTPRGLARRPGMQRSGSALPLRRRRVKAGAEAVPQAPGSHA